MRGWSHALHAEFEAEHTRLLASGADERAAAQGALRAVLERPSPVVRRGEIAGLRYRAEFEACLHFRVFETLAYDDRSLRGDEPLADLVVNFIERYDVDTRCPLVFVGSMDEFGFIYVSKRDGAQALGNGWVGFHLAPDFRYQKDLDPDEQAVVDLATPAMKSVEPVDAEQARSL